MKTMCMRYLLIFFFILSLCAACGGGGGGDGGGPAPASVKSGIFVDSAVDGLYYETVTQSGYTDNGTFKYMAGESVAFYIGNLLIGQGQAKSKMSPIDLVDGADDESNPTVINICRLLQSLDYDGNPDNGIVITKEVEDQVDNYLLNFVDSISNFENSSAIKDLFNSLNDLDLFEEGITGSLVSAVQAQAHLDASLNDLPDGSVKTAIGTYTYNSNSSILTIHYTDSTFTGCGPSLSRSDEFEVLSLTSTQMVFAEDDGPMVWTRNSGTGTDLVGNWIFYDSDNGNTYTVDIGDDGSVIVTGYIVFCDDGGSVGGTFTLPHKTITIDGNYGDWDSGDRVYLDEGGADCDNVPGLDLREVYLAQDTTFIYFRYVLNGPLNETFGYKFGEAFRHLFVNSKSEIFYASAYYNGVNLPSSFVHVDGNQFEAKFYKSDVKDYWIGEQLDAWLDQGVATICRDIIHLPDLIIDW